MVPTYLPFERPPDPYALWTAIPRGLRGFATDFGVLDAKPINDTQTLTFSATLPANFGYVFSDIGLRLAQDNASSWVAKYTLNLQSFYQGRDLGMSISYNFGFNVISLGAELANDHQVHDQVPSSPMWAPKGSSGILIVITARNVAAPAAAVGTVSAYINFWEFDLEQIRKFPINSPLPVHAR